MKLALPVALSQLGYIVVQFADNAMVGAYGGNDPLPLSAVSFGVMISFVMFSLCLGITLGLTPIVGEHFARGEYRRTAQYLQCSIVSYTLFGVVFMILQLLSVPLLYKLGQPVEVVDMAVPYYELMAYSLPAIMLYGCFKQFLEGAGNTVAPMVIAIITNLVNILFNWVFIHGHWGFEAMGVYGAGLATLIARYLSPLLIEYKGRRQIVGATANNMIGVNPDTGKIEWQYTIKPKTEASWANIAPNTPLFKDGKLFYSHGYDIFSFMLQIADDMQSVKLVWHNGDMDTQHGGYVLIDDTIYGTNHDRVSSAWCALDWQTGNTLYADAWANKSAGVVISADGMLYCYSERTGAVALVRPSREKFEVVSQFRITKGSGPHWAHPVIKDGVMYLRHGEALMAYKIK